MTPFNYDGRRFHAVGESPGEVDAATLFHYHQQDHMVWAEYSGGAIRMGRLVAVCDDHGVLDMRYSHINDRDELKTGICRSIPERLADGRIRLHESWQWTCDNNDTGTSIIEEIL